jgi:hypothetical protein
MKINRTEDFTEITVPFNKEWKRVFVFGSTAIVMLFLFCFGLFKIVMSLIYWNFEKLTFEFWGIFFTAFVLINYGSWVLIGKEKVIFKDKTMYYRITNGIFSKGKEIDIINIKNLRPIEKVYNSELFTDEGRIRFQYNNQHMNIFRGLKDEEIWEVAEIFKAALTIKTSHNSA